MKATQPTTGKFEFLLRIDIYVYMYIYMHIDTTDHDTFCLEKGYLRPASGYVVSMLKERNLFNLRSTYETYVKLMRMSYLAEAAGTSFETLSILLLFMSVEYKFKLISVLS